MKETQKKVLFKKATITELNDESLNEINGGTNGINAYLGILSRLSISSFVCTNATK